MIDAKLDAIIVDAGSSTALDRVIADACAKGIAVVNFDSLVDTKDLTTKIDTDQTNGASSPPSGWSSSSTARATSSS